jgi:hypothetical protein
MREILSENMTHSEFRFRGKEPGRLENFSDAVFALAKVRMLRRQKQRIRYFRPHSI